MTGRGGQQRIPRPPSYRLGVPPPWATIDDSQRRLSLETVRQRLADLPPARPALYAGANSRSAAVLVAMFEDAGEARLILTKRPDTMPSHQGEIAFPGGKRDPAVDADTRATALREAEEEIGLARDLVEIVAQLDEIGTVASQFTITPYMGFLATRPRLTPHPREVVKVFDVAISELLAPETYREERWDTHMADLPVHFYELPGETVWGATARILTNLLTHLTRQR